MNAQVRKQEPDPKLNRHQKDLLMSISGKRCAWRVRNGWRPKGDLTSFGLRTADTLIRHGLAVEVPGKGTTRLEATGAGEWLAREIKMKRQQEFQK
ncbi:hypothetical protein [Roseibium album]|uniref:hypothetical protein n=1 Tax=Roseibium album TaxID=311410 RepID=UPI0024930345|nr:hypothetical protein [Roseibium album]